MGIIKAAYLVREIFDRGLMREGGALALALLLLVASSAAEDGESSSAERKIEDRLIAHLRDQGAQVHFFVGQDCNGCERGAFMDRDVSKGDVVAFLPWNLTVQHRPPGEGFVGFAQEHAYWLAHRMHTDPAFNSTFQLWWRSQPSFSEVLTSETYSKRETAEMQSSWMEHHINVMQEVTRNVFRGGHITPPSTVPKPVSLNEAVAPSHITFRDFAHLSALLSTRNFVFWMEEKQQQRPVSLPAVDMLNNAEPGVANVEKQHDDEGMYLRALRDISKGEEIFHSYHPQLTHRCDMSFVIYGFVQRFEPPLLAAQDLPNFDGESPFAPTPENDTDLVPEGREEVAKEAVRAQAILDSLPTTLEEDVRLLEELKQEATAGGKQRPRMRAILEFRILRKQALRGWVQRLKGLLDEL